MWYYLSPGFTHSLQAYVGCGFAGTACGTFCYAQHNRWITKGRLWALYGRKADIVGAYCRDYDRIKHPRRGEPKPLKIYMSSSTDPYMPQEKKEVLTRALLQEMVNRPPDLIEIQTHSTLIKRDLDVIKQLANLCNLWVSITVETDMESVPGLPPHASSPQERIKTLALFRSEGVQVQATVSPLLPIAEPETFAKKLDQACDRVILDHYLFGDGSKNGSRTLSTPFPQLLNENGFSEWNSIDKYHEIRELFESVLGAERVLISSSGFNAV